MFDIRELICNSWEVLIIVGIALGVVVPLVTININKKLSLLSFIVILTAVISMGLVYRSSVKIPDVGKMSADNAIQTLKTLELQVDHIEKIDGLQVAKQVPAPGKWVSKNTKVLLEFSDKRINDDNNRISKELEVDNSKASDHSADSSKYYSGLPFNGYLCRSHNTPGYFGYNADTKEVILNANTENYKNARIMDVRIIITNYNVDGYIMYIGMKNETEGRLGFLHQHAGDVRIYITPGIYEIYAHKLTSQTSIEYIGYLDIAESGDYYVEYQPQ